MLGKAWCPLVFLLSGWFTQKEGKVHLQSTVGRMGSLVTGRQSSWQNCSWKT